LVAPKPGLGVNAHGWKKSLLFELKVCECFSGIIIVEKPKGWGEKLNADFSAILNMFSFHKFYHLTFRSYGVEQSLRRTKKRM